MMNYRTDRLSPETRKELYCLFHEHPAAAEYWDFVIRVADRSSDLEELAALFLRDDREASERSPRWTPPTSCVSITRISPSDSRVRMAAREEIALAFTRASIILNRPSSEQQIAVASEILSTQGWTAGEIEAAWKRVCSDPKAVNLVALIGSVGPSHFEMVRNDPTVMMGRLHSEQDAKAWAEKESGGDIRRRNVILGRWFQQVIAPDGTSRYALTTIAEDTHV